MTLHPTKRPCKDGHRNDSRIDWLSKVGPALTGTSETYLRDYLTIGRPCDGLAQFQNDDVVDL